MTSPPFRLALPLGEVLPLSEQGSYAPFARSCCPAPQEAAARPRRRARLSELEPHLHCSVIGTCLTTGELRKLVPRHTDLDRNQASDLDIHHAAVELALEGGDGAKALNKALDQRYEGALKRFQRAHSSEELAGCWDEYVRNGDIPAAYWALLTHPDIDSALRQRAFGEVHMLSHLVGAANRADIRRLIALEKDNAELHDKVDRQQERLLAATQEREELARTLAEREARSHAASATPVAQALAQRIAALETELQARDQVIAHHTQRREAAETRAQEQLEQLQTLQLQLDHALDLSKALQAEAAAAEDELAGRLGRAETGTEPGEPGQPLRGRRLVYVGGRPRSNHAIKSFVEGAGGELVVHDGGLEDRKGLLAAALPGADMVVFPVDCIDHDSVGLLKRLCERHGIAYHPLRSASLSSFMALAASLAAARAVPDRAPPVSRFCLRHG